MPVEALPGNARTMGRRATVPGNSIAKMSRVQPTMLQGVSIWYMGKRNLYSSFLLSKGQKHSMFVRCEYLFISLNVDEYFKMPC